MSFTIGPLAGLFDGFSYRVGPIYVTIADGIITSISDAGTAEIDGTNKILSVPFADGHTHLIFGGTRFFELDMKIKGSSYSDILAKGGGIKHTMSETRKASDEHLLDLVLQRLDIMMAHGTTTVEAKSGYGLNTEHEIRLLQILHYANEKHPIDLEITFGGAHVFPPDISESRYMEMLLDEMLPYIAENNLATTTDVFCDRGAFSVQQTMEIFDRSISLGLPVRVHAEEIEYTGIGKIASDKYKALSVDHLLLARRDDFLTYAKNGTVAMFMPLAPIGLFTQNRPRGYQNTGAIIGLGSDFNPNNWVLSMQTAIRMGVFTYKLSPLEAFCAASSGSYKGIKGAQMQKFDEGSSADFILLNSSSLPEFVSKFGLNLVEAIYKNGQPISYT